MTALNSKIIFALTILFIPFFTQAQITGNTSVCIESITSLADANTHGIWNSSDNGIATVDASGNVAGEAAGVATISYTYTNESFALQTDVLSITVNPKPGVSSISGNNTVSLAATTTLSNSLTGGAWSSNDNTIATVDAFGVVKGISAGNATIAYTVTNGCGSAYTTTEVYVTPLLTSGSVIASQSAQ